MAVVPLFYQGWSPKQKKLSLSLPTPMALEKANILQLEACSFDIGAQKSKMENKYQAVDRNRPIRKTQAYDRHIYPIDTLFSIRTSKFKSRLTVLNFFRKSEAGLFLTTCFSF